jgi:hypothetical protein
VEGGVAQAVLLGERGQPDAAAEVAAAQLRCCRTFVGLAGVLALAGLDDVDPTSASGIVTAPVAVDRNDVFGRARPTWEVGPGPSRAGRGRGMVAVRAGFCSGGKVLTDMAAAGLGADLGGLCWPCTMPDAASEAGDESGEICRRAGALLTLAGAEPVYPATPHGC